MKLITFFGLKFTFYVISFVNYLSFVMKMKNIEQYQKNLVTTNLN